MGYPTRMKTFYLNGEFIMSKLGLNEYVEEKIKIKIFCCLFLKDPQNIIEIIKWNS